MHSIVDALNMYSVIHVRLPIGPGLATCSTTTCSLVVVAVHFFVVLYCSVGDYYSTTTSTSSSTMYCTQYSVQCNSTSIMCKRRKELTCSLCINIDGRIH